MAPRRRLRDRVQPPVRVLFVGINPGMRSVAIGHHFGGHSSRFWRLLFDSGLVPERIGSLDDGRLPEWGYGITNVVSRATPGIDALSAADYVRGTRTLRRKVRRWRPGVVAFLGVTVYRRVFAIPSSIRVAPGFVPERFEGARLCVLPNPSGRNANFSYTEMLEAYRMLADAIPRDVFPG